ncbi:MAG TPA: MarR family transcriptional regulator, partial [Spongiibacteraceae bacterium]|nr:MarR family transcriptional regulator [Spongiibacteraceae bacterium]
NCISSFVTMSAPTSAFNSIKIQNPKGIYNRDNYSLGESLGYLIKRAGTMISNAIDQELASYDITHQQFSILVILSELKCQTAADLARETCGDTGAITRMLDRLEAKDFIRRVRSAEDRRVVNIELTPAGALCAEKMPIVAINVLNRHLEGFSKHEVEAVKTFLHRLLAIGGVHVPGAGDNS